MKYVILALLIIISIAAYVLWPVRYEPEGWVSLRDEERIEKEIIPEEEVVSEEKKLVEEDMPLKKAPERDESEYFTEIRDIIKDQWKELEECEYEFDDMFGHILKLGIEDQIRYLKDPGNLDIFLENLTNINWTTPSSAKMIKELAMPIASKVDPAEILDTVGIVKTCKVPQKRTLLTLLSYYLHQDKRAIFTYLTFLENEVSTLTYPRIIYGNVYELKSLFFTLKIDETKYPELKRLEKIFKNFVDLDIRTARTSSDFNPHLQRIYYKQALIIQKEIKKTLKAVKRDLLR
jgi:hypothetical protein